MRDPKKTTVREIMTADVLTFRDDEPLGEAVALLEEYRVSGAPVLNASDECIGVFSRADALKRRAEEEALGTAEPGELFDHSSTEGLEGEDETETDTEYTEADTEDVILERETVGQWMNSDVVSVRPETSVEEAAGRMASEGIHRLLVTEGKRLRGIVTALDLAGFIAGVPAAEVHRVAGKVRR